MALLQLDLLSAPPTAGATALGTPLLLALDSIEENPEQPRREFDSETLRELADTIAERGVRQPISVRSHPVDAGRWILNFGARRLRASRLAGLTEIPAYLDETADTYDQVIENEQREGLKPLELALFIQSRLTAGDNRAEIARRLGKSASWMTVACALTEAPDWLMALYREGRCRGMLELYELRRLHQHHGVDVERWAWGLPTIGRADVERLKAALGSGQERVGAAPGPRASSVAAGEANDATAGAREAASKESEALSGEARGTNAYEGRAPSVASDANAAHSVAPRASERLARCQDLPQVERAARAAVQTLKRAMAAMRAAPVGGRDALRELRAQLIELATRD